MGHACFRFASLIAVICAAGAVVTLRGDAKPDYFLWLGMTTTTAASNWETNVDNLWPRQRLDLRKGLVLKASGITGDSQHGYVSWMEYTHDNNHVDFKLIPMGEIEKVCGHFVCCLGLDVAHARATPVPLALGSPVLLFLPVYGL